MLALLLLHSVLLNALYTLLHVFAVTISARAFLQQTSDVVASIP